MKKCFLVFFHLTLSLVELLFVVRWTFFSTQEKTSLEYGLMSFYSWFTLPVLYLVGGTILLSFFILDSKKDVLIVSIASIFHFFICTYLGLEYCTFSFYLDPSA